MCGIVGILGDKPVAKRLVEGLRRLEYRGYDSAGIAVINDNQIQNCKAAGKIVNLDSRLNDLKIDGHIGIAHTRWATHGLPTETNAHPHINQDVAIVHNGIIENHSDLKAELSTRGYTFASQTDSEVIAHLLSLYEKETSTPLEAIFKTVSRLKGAYALAIIFKSDPNTLYGTRKGSPLALGESDSGERFIGSDALALAGLASSLTYLEDGDVAVLTRDSITIYDKDSSITNRDKQPYASGFDQVSRGPHRHFMKKEIHEQPDVVRQTLTSYISEDKTSITLPDLGFDVTKLNRISIVACGTSYYAGLVAKTWIETFAKVPVEVDIASEFRYRMPPLSANDISIFISQSGETADTLAAHQYAQSQSQKTVGIINVPNSSLARDVTAPLMTKAGPEIGVASSKAFSTQLVVLAALSLKIAYERGHLSDADMAAHCKDLSRLPTLIEQALEKSSECESVATEIAKAKDVLYLGRGTSFAIALEGALKLKEISYIHAEAYAAGEMKHGPIALVDENVPIVVTAPSDHLFEKTASNVEEAAARKGQIILISDQKGHETYRSDTKARLTMPETTVLTSPFVYTIPAQLLAYYTAVHKGTDVDQPRNLAKSVTVE